MYKRIALDLNTDTNHKRRLESAIQLALRHQAELVGIYTKQPAPQYLHEEAFPIQVLESTNSYVEMDAAVTKMFFLKEVQATSLEAQWRSPSRVREWILGGASKTLLESMTVPILFSH